jgi:pilus assembly protein CpaB
MQRAKPLLLAVMLTSLALIVALGVRLGFSSEAPVRAAPVAEERMVLAAAAPLAVGTLLRPQDLAWRPAPLVVAGEIERPPAARRAADPALERAAEAEALGSVVRRPIAAGEPIRAESIVKPGERGFLAAVLAPGTRAVAVAVTAASSAAGLIFPGDRVDVVLTQSFNDDEVAAGRRSVSETVAGDLRVLAIDQDLRGNAADGAERRGARTVTLEVSPHDAEKISVATELGKLSLTLRSLVDADAALAAARPAGPTWAADVSPALRARQAPQPKPAEARPVRIYRGTVESSRGT